MSAGFPDLRGASVFVTGGGSGIGAALTEAFAVHGARVAFVQRSDATEFCDAVEARHGNRPLFIPCDVTDAPALHDAVGQAAAAHGPVTVLVCNAARDMRRDTLGMDLADWQADLAINLTHAVSAARAVIPGMQAAGGGAIVMMSSIVWMMANGGMAAYETSKAGLVGLTRSLARDFGRDGVRVNAVAPGMILTERQVRDWLTPEAIAAHVERQCLDRRLGPEDMVGPVLFLASGASAAVTGQCLIADGGFVFG